jgi:hypothetical protein
MFDDRTIALDRALTFCKDNEITDEDLVIAVAEKFAKFLTTK